MDLYDRIKNISGKNNEEELIKAIHKVREALNGLVEERMCRVYSSFLLKELNDRHVPARMINTLDLGLEYEHVFVLVPANDKGYFLADLTFSQFNFNLEELNQLLNEGYQPMNDRSFSFYLNAIDKEKITDSFSVQNAFYSSKLSK